MPTLQRKLEILEDLEWRFKQIFQVQVENNDWDTAIDYQFDAFTDLMCNIDHYVDEVTEEEYELGDEFAVALIDIIYPEADNLHERHMEDLPSDICGIWLENTPLRTWEQDYESEALAVITFLKQKFHAMAMGLRPEQ